MSSASPTPAARRALIGAGAVALGAVALSTPAQAIPGSSQFPALNATSTHEWHLARRVCIAPTLDIVQEIKRLGATSWLEKQLAPSTIPDTKVESLIAQHFPVVTLPSIAEIKTATNNRPWESAPAMQNATILRHQFGNRHLLESMTEFMSDQVYVSVLGKGDSFAAHFNENVLRRHALGKFSDLLKAASRHPGALVPLDNHLNTKAAPNENYGRELLELHTVGAINPLTGRRNYTETDVRNASLLFTGRGLNWSTYEYLYNYANHQTGALRIMGWSHPNSGTSTSYNTAMVDSFLTYLAKHPATARRLMTRLAVRYVSDTPPSALIDRLVQTYLASDTNMVPVLRVLFTSAEFAAAKGQKVRRGQEIVGSVMRSRRPSTFIPAVDPKASPYGAASTYRWFLSNTGHGVREWPHVDGYPDQAKDWTTTGKLQGAFNMSEAILQGWDNDEFPAPALATRFGFKVGAPVFLTARRLTEWMTGWVWTTQDVGAVAAMLYNQGRSIPSSKATLTAEMLNTNLPMAARLVASSPHFLAR